MDTSTNTSLSSGLVMQPNIGCKIKRVARSQCKWLKRNHVSMAVIIICFVMNMHKLMWRETDVSFAEYVFGCYTLLLHSTSVWYCSPVLNNNTSVLNLYVYNMVNANFVFMFCFYFAPHINSMKFSVEPLLFALHKTKTDVPRSIHIVSICSKRMNGSARE